MLITEQRWNNDCVIATMAMYLAKPYAEVLQAYKDNIRPYVPAKGITPKEIIQLAALFGKKFRLKVRGKPRGKAFLVIKCPVSFHAVYYDGANAIDPQFCHGTTRDYLDSTIYFFTERFFL